MKKISLYILLVVFSLVIVSHVTMAKENQNDLDYTILPGDTLWSLSEKYYGSGLFWRKIVYSNGGPILNHYNLRSGQKVLIPGYNWDFESFGDGYYIENNEVFFIDTNKAKQLYDANPSTFSVLGKYYASDGINAYFNGEKIEYVKDPTSLEIVSEKYIKDKYNVYCNGELLQQADSVNFKIVPIFGVTNPDGWATDGVRVYYNCTLQEEYSADNFEVFWDGVISGKHVYINKEKYHIAENFDFNNNYILNDDKVYCNGKIFEEADSKSFKILGYQHAKDKNGLFKECRRISDLSNSAKYLGGNYSTDGDYIYVMGGKNTKIDTDSFEYLNNEFGIDKNSVYRNSVIVKEANSTSIEVLSKTFLRDDSNVYYVNHDNKNIILDEADASSFVPLSYSYGKDINNIYFVDCKTSRALTNCSYKIIEGADVNSFKALDGQQHYQIDNKNVYFQGEKIEGADPDTFMIVRSAYAKDKRYLYKLGERVNDNP